MGESIAPKCQLCDQMSKYTCPKCGTKTCSVECVKRHKITDKCDGERISCPKFIPIRGYSTFTDDISFEDQQFLHTIKSSMGIKRHNEAPIGGPPVKLSNYYRVTSDGEEVTTPEKANESVFSIDSLPVTQRMLLSSAHHRRIWLSVKSPKDCGDSRYDKFSDTIFWTVGVQFIYQRSIMTECLNIETEIKSKPSIEIEQTTTSIISDPLLSLKDYDDETLDGNNVVVDETPINDNGNDVEIQNYIVKNIPESLTLNTLIRQFVKPKKFGPVVSKSDLDMEKMQKFIDAGAEENGLLVYMKVPYGSIERYYTVDLKQTLLNNFRNRYIAGHPIFLVTLSNQFEHFQGLSEVEAKQLQESRRNEFRMNANGGNKFGGGHHKTFGNKCNNQNRPQQQWFNGGCRGGNFHRNNNNNNQKGNYIPNKRDNYHGNARNPHYRNNKSGFRDRRNCGQGYERRFQGEVEDIERFLEDPNFGQSRAGGENVN